NRPVVLPLPFPPRAAKSPDHITDPHPFRHVKQNEFTAQKGTAPTSSSSKRKAGRRDRPRRRAAEQRDEIAAAAHSITSSARASSVGGTSRPSALAVLRLMINSTFRA